MFSQQQSEFFILLRVVGNLFQFGEGVVKPVFFLHPFEVLNEILLRFRTKPPTYQQLPQPQVGVRSGRRASQHLVVKSDGVVRQPDPLVVFGRFFIHLDRGVSIVLLEVQVPDLVQKREFVVHFGSAVKLINDLPVIFYRFFELIFRFEFARLVF